MKKINELDFIKIENYTSIAILFIGLLYVLFLITGGPTLVFGNDISLFSALLSSLLFFSPFVVLSAGILWFIYKVVMYFKSESYKLNILHFRRIIVRILLRWFGAVFCSAFVISIVSYFLLVNRRCGTFMDWGGNSRDCSLIEYIFRTFTGGELFLFVYLAILISFIIALVIMYTFSFFVDRYIVKKLQLKN